MSLRFSVLGSASSVPDTWRVDEPDQSPADLHLVYHGTLSGRATSAAVLLLNTNLLVRGVGGRGKLVKSDLDFEIFEFAVLVDTVSSEGERNDPRKLLSFKAVVERRVQQIVDEGVDPGGLADTGAAQDQNVQLVKGLSLEVGNAGQFHKLVVVVVHVSTGMLILSTPVRPVSERAATAFADVLITATIVKAGATFAAGPSQMVPLSTESRTGES